MNRLPQITSLVAQTTLVIRDEIDAGRWTGWLPGEHDLSAQLHVSRRTVRAALAQLSHEGIIKCAHGRRRQIVGKLDSAKKVSSNRVVLLIPAPLEMMNPLVVYLADRLRQSLTEHGYAMETHSGRLPYRARAPQRLEAMAKTLDPAGWVLLNSTPQMQRWFEARQFSCVVIGSLHEGIALPAVDVDYRAICHHAVNQFVTRGHRHIALLNPRPEAAGDVKTVEGFHNAVAKANLANLHATVVQHDCDLNSICARVDALLARSDPPTAFLVSRARHILTVMGHLLKNGVRIPEDVALISRDDEAFLADMVPTIARYSISPNVFANKVSRVILHSLQGSQRIVDQRIMPKFIRGATLG